MKPIEKLYALLEKKGIYEEAIQLLKEHASRLKEDVQTDPRITITYEIWDDESLEAGDTDNKGWIDDEGVSMKPDQYDIEDGKTSIELAIDFLKENGALEASSSHFHPGVWYTNDKYNENFKTGEVEQRSFHLKGFSPEEEQSIFNAITKNIEEERFNPRKYAAKRFARRRR